MSYTDRGDYAYNGTYPTDHLPLGTSLDVDPNQFPRVAQFLGSHAPSLSGSAGYPEDGARHVYVGPGGSYYPPEGSIPMSAGGSNSYSGYNYIHAPEGPSHNYGGGIRSPIEAGYHGTGYFNEMLPPLPPSTTGTPAPQPSATPVSPTLSRGSNGFRGGYGVPPPYTGAEGSGATAGPYGDIYSRYYGHVPPPPPLLPLNAPGTPVSSMGGGVLGSPHSAYPPGPPSLGGSSLSGSVQSSMLPPPLPPTSPVYMNRRSFSYDMPSGGFGALGRVGGDDDRDPFNRRLRNKYYDRYENDNGFQGRDRYEPGPDGYADLDRGKVYHPGSGGLGGGHYTRSYQAPAGSGADYITPASSLPPRASTKTPGAEVARRQRATSIHQSRPPTGHRTASENGDEFHYRGSGRYDKADIGGGPRRPSNKRPDSFSSSSKIDPRVLWQSLGGGGTGGVGLGDDPRKSSGSLNGLSGALTSPVLHQNGFGQGRYYPNETISDWDGESDGANGVMVAAGGRHPGAAPRMYHRSQPLGALPLGGYGYFEPDERDRAKFEQKKQRARSKSRRRPASPGADGDRAGGGAAPGGGVVIGVGGGSGEIDGHRSSEDERKARLRSRPGSPRLPYPRGQSRAKSRPAAGRRDESRSPVRRARSKSRRRSPSRPATASAAGLGIQRPRTPGMEARHPMADPDDIRRRREELGMDWDGGRGRSGGEAHCEGCPDCEQELREKQEAREKQIREMKEIEEQQKELDYWKQRGARASEGEESDKNSRDRKSKRDREREERDMVKEVEKQYERERREKKEERDRDREKESRREHREHRDRERRHERKHDEHRDDQARYEEHQQQQQQQQQQPQAKAKDPALDNPMIERVDMSKLNLGGSNSNQDEWTEATGERGRGSKERAGRQKGQQFFRADLMCAMIPIGLCEIDNDDGGGPAHNSLLRLDCGHGYHEECLRAMISSKERIPRNKVDLEAEKLWCEKCRKLFGKKAGM